MGKKKKSQLKPVGSLPQPSFFSVALTLLDRGFATTSVPKKLVPVPEPEPVPPASDAGPSTTDLAPNVHENAIAEQDKAEEQLLQDLVEKHQEKTEREIIRYVNISSLSFTWIRFKRV